MRRFAAGIAAATIALSGCGGGHPAQPTPYPDPEPVNPHLSLGPLPGTPGSNGQIASSFLRPIQGGRLGKPAAAAWNTMNLAANSAGRHVATPNGPDSSYRSYARQVYWRSYWCNQGRCGNAATPGTSNHGWARAVDTGCTASRSTVSTYGSQVGWRWGEVPYECWHVTFYAGGFSHPDPGIDYRYPVLSLGSGGIGQSAFVRRVQSQLKDIGFSITSTGVYGDITAHEVFVYEKQRGYKTPNTSVTKATYLNLVDSVNRVHDGRSPYP